MRGLQKDEESLPSGMGKSWTQVSRLTVISWDSGFQKLCQTSSSPENLIRVGAFKKNLTGQEILDNVMILVNSASHCSKELHSIHKLMDYQDKTG